MTFLHDADFENLGRMFPTLPIKKAFHDGERIPYEGRVTLPTLISDTSDSGATNIIREIQVGPYWYAILLEGTVSAGHSVVYIFVEMNLIHCKAFGVLHNVK